MGQFDIKVESAKPLALWSKVYCMAEIGFCTITWSFLHSFSHGHASSVASTASRLLTRFMSPCANFRCWECEVFRSASQCLEIGVLH